MRTVDARTLSPQTTPVVREACVEFHRRLAFPAAVSRLRLAPSFGSTPRRGAALPASVARVILIASYYLLRNWRRLSTQGALPPAPDLGSKYLAAALGLALLPAWSNPRRSQWMNPTGRFQTWARLLRRRKAARTAAALAVTRFPTAC